jgi:intracellular sulfur oxidation DsrE/DsrF family protein
MMRKTGVAAALFVGLSMCWGLGASQAVWAAGVAENTLPPKQIVQRRGIKVVIQVNSKATTPKGISKQILATKMLLDQYAALKMKSGKDYKIVMVFRAAGAQFMLNDAAYERKVKQPHPKGNPNSAILRALHKRGVKMYECHVAMKMKGYQAQDLFSFSRVVTTGIGAVVDFEKSGYLLVTP